MADHVPDEAPGAAGPVSAILVVDDNATSRLAMRAMLAPLGYAVIEADSGRAALRSAVRQRFAVILMDVRMPIMDGYETAELIRQGSDQELTPIIFVTAYGQDEVETAAAYASGAVDFIFTPLRPYVLRAKVSRFVEIFERAREQKCSLESITTLNAALHESEMRAQAVLQNVADGIVTVSEDGVIESFNYAARRLFGYREDEVIGQPLALIIASSHRDDFCHLARAGWRLVAASDTAARATETVGCRKDGSRFPMEIDVSHMRIGEQTCTIGCIRDISDRKAYTDALEHRALYDDLTALPNRTLFADRVDRAIAAADRGDQPCGILVIDLDAFRKVNETLGLENGDALLRQVAQRLRRAMHDSDTVARLGGDEFGILPSGTPDVETAAAAAWRVGEALEHPFLINGHVVTVRASIGISFFPQHGRATPDLLRRAELATHEAKRSGSGLAVFVADPEDQTALRLTLLSELRDAIPSGELVLHYQPKVDLVTRHTTGVEALVRWRHPTRGFLMPAAFMPEAERSDLIEPLTAWVLDEALHQQRIWRDQGIDLTMAVNISAQSLSPGHHLPETVAKLTEKWGIAPGRLILELTERAMINAEVPGVLDVLHTMGESLAIDDFGTGYSSLVHLQQLPIQQIKVDRSFVIDLASVPSNAVIVRATIELAHNLGLTAVAEGVEDEIALGMLVDYGCDSAQGYLFSRPCEADKLATWLAESEFGALAALSVVTGNEGV